MTVGDPCFSPPDVLPARQSLQAAEPAQDRPRSAITATLRHFVQHCQGCHQPAKAQAASS